MAGRACCLDSDCFNGQKQYSNLLAMCMAFPQDEALTFTLYIDATSYV